MSITRLISGNALLVAACALAGACAGDNLSTDIISPTPQDAGRLEIEVKVNGDPMSSSRGFILKVNDQYGGDAVLNGRRFFVEHRGDYRIAIESQYDILDEPSWCYVPRGNTVVAHIGKDSTTAVTFTVECPPLTGTARMLIHGVATGANAPAEIKYLVGRIHPAQPWPSNSLRIAVGGVNDLTGPPGIYVIVPDQAEKCDPTLQNFLGAPYPMSSAGYVIARDGQVVDVSSPLRCP